MYRDELIKILQICREQEDPFKVNVVDLLERVRKIFPLIRTEEEINLDLEALLSLSDVVLKQEDIVEHKTSLLYVDALLVLLKLEKMSLKELADSLRRNWKPIVEARGININFLLTALDYWGSKELLGKDIPIPPEREVEISMELSEELEKELERIKGEIKGEVDYHEFIKEDPLRRAYLISILATRGDISLRKDPMTEKITILPHPSAGEKVSMVIEVI
ncbi:MAG: hypothetical protein C0200_05035 [Thermoproteota archaeon]|nr:MAG: hypothetical protein C0200_05035 [Candidatus Korarchaeota archaeon]